MKRLLFVLSLISLSLTGCNAKVGLGTLNFRYIHIQMHEGEPIYHLKISKWKSDEGGIEVDIDNYGTALFGDGTYTLYTNAQCPLCGDVTYKN